jgi:2-polyprenyl-6-methoxyphenol hydroxylase-like FAD-dependent oxidoreductase
MIAIHHSAIRTFQSWPGFLDRAKRESYGNTNHYKKFDGTPVGAAAFGKPGEQSMILNRAQLHRTLVDYAQEIGIPIEHAAHVVEYLDDDDNGSGVRLADGRALFADVVVAADGAGSKSFDLVLGHPEEVVSSGYAAYRATFDHAEAFQNPIIAKEFNTADNRIWTYMGPNAHVVVGKTDTRISWVMTHAVSERLMPAVPPVFPTGHHVGC